MKNFGTKLRAAREKLKLTRAEVFGIWGIPTRTLEDWEAGKRTPPEWLQNMVMDVIK